MKTKPSAESGQDVDWSQTFNWSLDQFFQHLTEVYHLRDQQAVAEIHNAIGSANVPYRVFEELDGRLASKKAGSADFWRADVRLCLVTQDAERGEIEPKVSVSPSGGIGWKEGNFIWRVPARVVRGQYTERPKKPALAYGDKSRTQQQILLFTDEEFPDGWDHLNTNVLMKQVSERFKEAGLTAPERATFERAYDRRRD